MTSIRDAAVGELTTRAELEAARVPVDNNTTPQFTTAKNLVEKLIPENLSTDEEAGKLLTTSTSALANTDIFALAATRANDASTLFMVTAPPDDAGTRYSGTLHLETGNYTGAHPRAEFTVVEVAMDGTRTTLVDSRGIYIDEHRFTPINIQPDNSTSTLEIQVTLRTISAYGNATAQLINQSWIEPGRLEARARAIADEEAKKTSGEVLGEIHGKADDDLANLDEALTAAEKNRNPNPPRHRRGRPSKPSG